VAPWLTALIVFLPMLIEARRSARNESALRARGGIEPEDDVYPLMRIAYPAAFVAMIAEGLARGGAGTAGLVAGAVVFVLAKAIKYWAIAALGERWTFRVIVVPGAPLVRTGPYRFLRHPNYVGVIGEIVGVALLTGAIVTGPIAALGFGVLVIKRIAVEERALRLAARAQGRRVDAILREN
jgi:methyltransferase